MAKQLFAGLILCMLFSGAAAAQVDLEQTPGLKVGDKAPVFTAVTHEGNHIALSELLDEKEVVLVFYRGAWCPYCNIHLQQFQSVYDEFEKRGVQVLGVSVDLQEPANKAVAENALSFPVISDPAADILKSYNLVFNVPVDLQEKMRANYGIDLEKHSGRNDGLIAIPATYVINQDGVIVFAYANKDYKTRTHPQEVLQVLDTLI